MAKILIEKTIVDACLIALSDLLLNVKEEDKEWVGGIIDRLEQEIQDSDYDNLGAV